VDRYVSARMTLGDPNPGFEVTVYLQVEYHISKTVRLREKVTVEHLVVNHT